MTANETQGKHGAGGCERGKLAEGENDAKGAYRGATNRDDGFVAGLCETMSWSYFCRFHSLTISELQGVDAQAIEWARSSQTAAEERLSVLIADFDMYRTSAALERQRRELELSG